MTTTLTRSIPIPSNPRGVPESSYGTSPQASTSPLASFGGHSTSPQNPTFLSGSGRKNTGNVFQSFARQLTAFLPNTYPIGEQDEDAEAKAKRHGKLRILLLENINVDASDFLKKQGYEVSYILLSGLRYGEAAKWKDADGLVGIGVQLGDPCPDVWAS
jgi:D-3-phosphoglycerate dehydrogenase